MTPALADPPEADQGHPGAGITKRVRAHGLRRTFANELANEGERIHVIRRQLGHSNAATTASYLDHIAPGDVVQAIKKREWAA